MKVLPQDPEESGLEGGTRRELRGPFESTAIGLLDQVLGIGVVSGEGNGSTGRLDGTKDSNGPLVLW
jgi:hypothetical protein